MGKNPLFRAFLIALMTFAISHRAQATTTYWQGPATGGVFNDDENWSEASPGDNSPLPQGPNDRAVFDTTIDGTLTFDANATHAATDIKSTGGTLTFDTGTNKWVTTGTFTVGAYGLSTPGYPKIRQVGGYIEAFHFLMGYDDASPGVSWEISGPTAHLHSIRPSGGLSMGVGPNADETQMWVHNGGKLTTAGQAILGLGGSSNCLLTIEGAGTIFSAANYLGVGHTGIVGERNASGNKAIIRDSATASASNLYLGISIETLNNEIAITGAGTTFALNGTGPTDDGRETLVGWRGPNNILRIEDGAAVTGKNYFIIGKESTSNAGNQLILSNSSLSSTGVEPRRGSVTVTNSTLDMVQWYDENLEVYNGGGIVSALSSSVFTFNSGTVRSVNATVSNGAAFNVGTGGATPATYFMRLDQAGARGTHSFANGLALGSNGVLAGNGNITGNVSGAAGAKVDVGASAGIINVTGAWNNTGVGIQLELDNLATSTAPGVQFDQLNVSGAFTHGGTVAIDVSQLVGPASATQLKLIGWGSQVGASASTIVSFLGGAALPYVFQADGLYVTAQASAALAGDYNSDGKIDAADYTVWRDNLGAATIPNRGPGITGVVGPDDYNYWKTHFGMGAGSGATFGAAVPEPASWCLILTVVTCGLAWRRPKSHDA
jgi:hypothetical protein